MTFEKILNDLSMNMMTAQEAYNHVIQKDKLRSINFYAALRNVLKEPLNDQQLQELNAIVGVLQILYNSGVGSPIEDSVYDTLQEELIDMGIPRLTGTIEINDATKIKHQHPQLRGSLDKVYYLTSNEPRTNKSRKSLDEWIRSAENRYYKISGRKIDLNEVDVILQPKFDGVSAVEEIEKKPVWITRGNTKSNQASDISHIMHIFNTIYEDEEIGTGIKYEVMMTEENKDVINSLYRNKKYKNSRQIVTSILNSNEADFKAEYLYPVPLRIIHPGEDIESIHPDLKEKFPTAVCKLGDREEIKDFSRRNRYISYGGMRFRTDGVVITILDHNICRVLGREKDINLFEVAYKFTEEVAYSKVKDIEFYVSEFGFVTPVLVVNDVIMKGNTINHITLSNKERFDELDLHIGDTVKVLYDIIPYVVIDDTCHRNKFGKKIEFIKKCPRCKHPLELDAVMVRCQNPKCPSRIIGRILNYCNILSIKNVGWSTLELLYDIELLENGIASLYKLKKHANLIETLEGFGKRKTKKLLAEIEAKRKLQDYMFFGALGIPSWNTKSFQTLFESLKLQEFLDMIRLKNFNLLEAKIIAIPSMGNLKASKLIEVLKDDQERKLIQKLLKEVKLIESFGRTPRKGRIVFSGCRPTEELRSFLINHGWDPSDSWSNKVSYLVIPNDDFSSSKVNSARARNVPIIVLSSEKDSIKVLKEAIPDFE